MAFGQIRSKASTAAYREGFDRAFGKKVTKAATRRKKANKRKKERKS
jgi:hypothetical protein